MNQRTVSKLGDEAKVRPADKPTKQQLLLTVARMFSQRQDEEFAAITTVEFKTDNVIRAISAYGTVLEPIVALLNELDIPTEPNALAVRTSLDLMNPEFHDLVCVCKGEIVAGHVFRERFERLAFKF
jgi:hypothetical protein